MFTGIIEEIGSVKAISREAGNIHFTIAAKMTKELKVDQSIAHNGCCLTVVAIHDACLTIQGTESMPSDRQWKPTAAETNRAAHLKVPLGNTRTTDER